MNIYINGQPLDVADDIDAARLLEHLGLTGKRLALEVNQEIVPRGTFATHRFKADDRVEIIHAIGGG